MAEENQKYRDLPRLRAQLSEHRAAGHHPEAEELAAEIERLTAAAKRDAARVVRERAEAKERFQQLVRSIRELQGSAAEVPGGPEARDARIRDLAQQARSAKTRHEALTERVREFQTILAAGDPVTERGGQSAETLVHPATSSAPDPADSDSDRPRRRWLVPAIIGAAVVVLLAGLFGASTVVDSRVEKQLEDGIAQLLTANGLEGLVAYDDLSVSSLLGSVTFRGVRVTDHATGDGARADRVTVRVPRLEALRARTAIARGNDEDARLSSLALDAQGVTATTSEGDAFRVESVRGTLEGDLSRSLLDEPAEDQLLRIDRAEITISGAELLAIEPMLEGLREIGWTGEVRDLTRVGEFFAEIRHDRSAREVVLAEYRLATPLFSQSGDARVAYAGDLGESDAWIREVGFRLHSTVSELPAAFAIPGASVNEKFLVDIPSVEITLSGETVFADESMELDFERSSADVSLIVGEGAVALPASALQDLARFAVDVDELVSAGAVRLERFALDAGLRAGGAIELRELSLRAPVAELTVSGQASVNDMEAMAPGSVSLSGSVQRLASSLREPLGGFVLMLGAIVPESGPFEFSFALDESGQPVLRIE